MFKKVYVEITNKCNLSCAFCSKSKREYREISKDEFEIIVSKLDKYTDYLYLHVKGEPLLHSDLNGILEVARKYKKKVNITTNGTLLKRKKDLLLRYNDVIRQINISMHALLDNVQYIEDVCLFVLDVLSNSNIIISLRFWNIVNGVDNNGDVYKILKDKLSIDDETFNKIRVSNSVKIGDNLYLNKDSEFIWPNMDNLYYNDIGKCYGTITHIGILSDGTIIPCCLDGEGVIKLGNIFENSMEDVIHSELFLKIRNGFLKNKKMCELCKKCSFLEK